MLPVEKWPGGLTPHCHSSTLRWERGRKMQTQRRREKEKEKGEVTCQELRGYQRKASEHARKSQK